MPSGGGRESMSSPGSRCGWYWCAPTRAALRSRPEQRGLLRDRGTLDVFDALVARMRPGVPPPVPHFAVDNRLRSHVALTDQLRAGLAAARRGAIRGAKRW